MEIFTFTTRYVRQNNKRCEYSDDYEDVQNPSSTPIVPNRLKTVLSFTNIQVPNADVNQLIQENGNEQVRPKPAEISTRESLRNIDDILDDIEGDFNYKTDDNEIQRFAIFTHQGTQRWKKAEVNAEEVDKMDSTGDSNDGDDSLIDILTQKYVEKRKSESQITIQGNTNQKVEPRKVVGRMITQNREEKLKIMKM